MPKTCFRCRADLPVSAFYAHPQMADGVLGKCKTCTKEDVRVNRALRRDQYSAYERDRFKTPKRKAQVAASMKRHRAKHPERAAARTAVNNAVRDGRLVRGPCTHCGTTLRVQGHHHDYSKPLDVVWACFKCHREKEHGQATVGIPSFRGDP